MWEMFGAVGYCTAAVLWLKCYKLFGDDRMLARLDPVMQRVVELELPEYNLWKVKRHGRRGLQPGG
jgi:hypothetical protein